MVSVVRRAKIAIWIGIGLVLGSMSLLVLINSPRLVFGSSDNDILFVYFPRQCGLRIFNVDFQPRSLLGGRLVNLRFDLNERHEKCNPTISTDENEILPLEKSEETFDFMRCPYGVEVTRKNSKTTHRATLDVTKTYDFEKLTGIANQEKHHCSLILPIFVIPRFIDLARQQFTIILLHEDLSTPASTNLSTKLNVPQTEEVLRSSDGTISSKIILSHHNIASWVLILNIVFSTVIGVGISAVFEGVLAITTVRAVQNEIARIQK